VREYQIYPEPDELGRDFSKALDASLAPAILNPHVFRHTRVVARKKLQTLKRGILAFFFELRGGNGASSILFGNSIF
jgi:hypothetical protein